MLEYRIDSITGDKVDIVQITQDTPYRAGQLYWCSYWRYWYKVIRVNGMEVTIVDSAGVERTHLTPLRKGDGHVFRVNGVCAHVL